MWLSPTVCRNLLTCLNLMAQIVLLLPCYRNFVHQLGEADAIVECIELASRDLKSRATTKPSVVDDLSEQHGVRVNQINWDTFLNDIARMHLVSVYQQLEYFYKSLPKQHPSGGSWRKLGDKEPRIDFLMSCMGVDESSLGEHRVRIVEYYRLTRNQYVHSLAEKETQTNYRNSLLSSRNSWSTEYPLAAPNALGELTFDDFILFTRAAKDLAYEFCKSIDPNTENVVKGLQRLDQIENSNISITRLSRYKNSTKNLLRKLERTLQCAFGFDKLAIDYFIDGHPDGLLAQLVERQAP